MFNAFTLRLIIDKFNVNPHLVALEDIIQREVDEKFTVNRACNRYYRNELISDVIIYGDDEVYYQPDILLKVEKAQKLVFSYVMEHKEAFEFYKSDNPRVKFYLYFENESYRDGHPGRVSFALGAIEGGDYDRLGFNSLCIYGHYKLSNINCFTDFTFLKLEYITIDSTDVLDEMKKLKSIDLLEGIDGDIAGLRQKAESLGIVVNGYEYVEDMEDEEKKPKIQWDYDLEVNAEYPFYWMK